MKEVQASESSADVSVYFFIFIILFMWLLCLRSHDGGKVIMIFLWGKFSILVIIFQLFLLSIASSIKCHKM